MSSRRTSDDPTQDHSPGGARRLRLAPARGVNAPARELTAKLEPSSQEVALYEIRKRIHPRAVHGWFARWRWTLVFVTQAIFYGLPWLQLSGPGLVSFADSNALATTARFNSDGVYGRRQELDYGRMDL